MAVLPRRVLRVGIGLEGTVMPVRIFFVLLLQFFLLPSFPLRYLPLFRLLFLSLCKRLTVIVRTLYTLVGRLPGIAMELQCLGRGLGGIVSGRKEITDMSLDVYLTF